MRCALYSENTCITSEEPGSPPIGRVPRIAEERAPLGLTIRRVGRRGGPSRGTGQMWPYGVPHAPASPGGSENVTYVFQYPGCGQFSR